MTTPELIKALKNKPSRDNRQLLNECAERLNELNLLKNAYKEAFETLVKVCDTLMEELKNEKDQQENSN